MKRVLVTGASMIGKAGVATIVYKWGQEFESSHIVYDYLMQSGLPDKEYLDKIYQKGGIIYTTEKKLGIIDKIKWVKKVIKDNHYDIFHINSDSAYVAAGYIMAAKSAGIKNIYVHSHCTQIDDNNKIRRTIKTVLHKLCMPYVIHNTQLFLACSELAGYWMFGKKYVNSEKYKTINNGVEVEKYLLNCNLREKYREELGISKKFAICNIGRLSYQKNQEHLIEIFSKYSKKDEGAVLIIVGDGELKNELQKKVSDLNLEKKVIFLGLRNDVPQLLSAMDVMVMPSRFEGLPVTLVEAQMADLPCVVSDNITKEANFSGIVKYVNMSDMNSWLSEISKTKKYIRDGHFEQRVNSNFNIKHAANELAEVLLTGDIR